MQPNIVEQSETWWYTHPHRAPEEATRFAMGTTETPAVEQTAKIERFDVEDMDPDRLDLAEDAHLTMQLRAVKSGRGIWIGAILTSLAAMAIGIALVL